MLTQTAQNNYQTFQRSTTKKGLNHFFLSESVVLFGDWTVRGPLAKTQITKVSKSGKNTGQLQFKLTFCIQVKTWSCCLKQVFIFQGGKEPPQNSHSTVKRQHLHSQHQPLLWLLFLQPSPLTIRANYQGRITYGHASEPCPCPDLWQLYWLLWNTRIHSCSKRKRSSEFFLTFADPFFKGLHIF